MVKKIVIEPCFNEAHFLEFQIPNICDYLKPDVFVIAEGMFPEGPEGLIRNDSRRQKLIENFSLHGGGKRSFDFKTLRRIVEVNKEKYPGIEFHLLAMNYENCSTLQCYQKAYTSFLNVTKVSADDIIFPLECDLFFTKAQAQAILELSNTLSPGTDFGSTYAAFFESPRVSWWTDSRASRRIAYKYGDGKIWGNYDGVPGTGKQFGKTKMHDLKLFHYDYMRPPKYWDFRMMQLVRAEKRYDNFEAAGSFIRQRPPHTAETNKILQYMGWHPTRPWLSLNDLELEDHPVHIWLHENFRYYYDGSSQERFEKFLRIKSKLPTYACGEVPNKAFWHFYDVIKLVKPKSILEIGCRRGVSAAMWLCASDADVTSIDTYINAAKKIYPVKDDTLDFQPGITYLKQRAFKGRFDMKLMDSAMLPIMLDWQDKFDLAFIDGCHSFKYILLDAINCVRLGIKWILFDDYYSRATRKPILHAIDKLNLTVVKEYPGHAPGFGGQCLTKFK